MSAGVEATILVVEDESILAMLLEDFLLELGHRAPTIACTVCQALETLAARDVRFAILDINLGGETSFPVADRLDALGIPYIFTTGYGAAGVPERLRSRYILQKPYGADDLRRAIAAHGPVAN
ncbi:response regulator [Luteimonas deserti]|uniref:Response regulator n=1 Tax=Luteimonas deserti TaxID=2752306 RepID=A0A7Z0QSG1_9GAMM|nr:response regulator [Luteimonas deserti]NYZ62170.1 response regulator [Luteimonas deserti]